jgi:hypothetical protein
MKKYKIKKSYSGRYDIYSRSCFFFWEFRTCYYNYNDAKSHVEYLIEADAYKPKVWFF